MDQTPLVSLVPCARSAASAVFGDVYSESLPYTQADLMVASRCAAVSAIGQPVSPSKSLGRSHAIQLFMPDLPLSVARFSIISEVLGEIIQLSPLITTVGLYAQTTTILLLLDSNEMEGWDCLRKFAVTYAGSVSRLLGASTTRVTHNEQTFPCISDARAAVDAFSNSLWTSDDDTLLLGSRRQLLLSLAALERTTPTSLAHITALAQFTPLLSSLGEETEAAEFERPLYLLLAGAVRSLLEAER